MAQNNEIRYLNPPTVEVRERNTAVSKGAGIKYVDYKDAEFLKKFSTSRARYFLVVSPEHPSNSRGRWLRQ